VCPIVFLIALTDPRAIAVDLHFHDTGRRHQQS
jgi:hypothetical protein